MEDLRTFAGKIPSNFMKRLLLFVFFLLAVVTARSQYTFHTFDIQSGLIDNDVRAILRDQYGFMWFGTINGLDRYDGYHCKTYLAALLGNYENTISAIHEDADGRIWIQATRHLFIYDREADRLSSDIHPTLASMGIEGDIRLLQADVDKNLWCVSGHTLYKYVFADKVLLTLSLPEEAVLAFTTRGTVAYLLLANGEIVQADLGRNRLCPLMRIDRPERTHLYLDTRNRLWHFNENWPGLNCYDTSGDCPIRFSSQEILRTELVNAVIDDGQGNIWIGTNDQGIFIEDKDQKNFSHLHSRADQPFELPNNHVSCFYQDRLNTMWVGTSKQGVAFTSLQNCLFETYRTPAHEDIGCFLEDKAGNLWIGFDGKGLLCRTPDGTRDVLYTTRDQLPSNLVIGAYPGKGDRIWFSTYGNGVFYREKNRFVPVHFPVKAEEDSPIRFARHLVEDKDGSLWIGTLRNGLVCRDKNGRFTVYDGKNSCLRGHTITALSYVPGSDRLYVGTNGGLYKMDLSHKTLSRISVRAEDGQKLDSSYIHCLHQDRRGLLWIGTFDGLLIYDGKSKELPRLTHRDPTPRIVGIAEDLSGNLWVTTQKNIIHIVVVEDPARRDYLYRCYPYFSNDGIGDITFNARAIYCTSRGEILVGGNGQYAAIRPDIRQYEPESHRVSFTGLYVANRPVNVGEADKTGRIILPKNIQLLDRITLDHSDVNFTIEVSSMDYLTQHKLQFAYRTDPKEEFIRMPDNKIYFNQLSPGTYRLQVRVDEPNGDSNPVSELVIHIRPPFWLSGPAFGLYILICLGLVILYAHWSHQKHRRTLLQQKKEMEAAQQHEMDEAKLRFFTNISHDLRTPLSLIITPLDQLLKSGKAPAAKEELELMRRNASTLMNEVNQLLDFRRLDQQKAQYVPTYGNLSAFVAGVCEAFTALAQKNGISLQFTARSPLLEMNFDRNKMQRILYNLLTNALKYNHEGGSVTVTVDEVLTPDGAAARIRVADTGIGIKDENKPKIFDRFFQEPHTDTTYMGSGIGLHIVKEYVALHRGTITLTDNHPTGSIFSVLIPIDRSQTATQAEQTQPVQPDAPAGLPEAGQQSDNCLLIVEDNEDFRKFLVSCLKDKYRVLEASNGQEALEVLEQQTVNLIISDVMMPVMDGMELCRRVKHDIRYSHIPIILLTARTAEEHVLNGLKEGADDYITKPFNLEILLLRIQKQLAWTQENHRKFQVMDVSPAEITVSTIDEELIGKAVQIMEQEMDNADFSVEDFSNRLGLSRSGLYKKLVQITGKSPLEFMRTIRLKRGKALLEKSGDSISQIAYQIGMSPKQFSKFFKEEFGYLPSEYKKHAAETSR